jgi:hypothetical protein
LPSRAVAEAMNFLLADWLADVAADHAGKCCLIALACTMIERTLLDQRPCWFITAGQRGNGKTTTIKMLIEGVTDAEVSASAWSTNEEERRKALLAYLVCGTSYILWDNIARGAQVACPHIEKACTAAMYADRKLGSTEMVRAAASSVHIFTGNNIAPKGDLASRSLVVRLDTDRIDPENRDFRHPDPLCWTEDNRPQILRALFTVLLGNPSLDLPRDAPMKTRFKLWQRLVGSAVEHAAHCAAQAAAGFDPGGDALPEEFTPLDFGTLFLGQEAGEEDAVSLAEALIALAETMKSRDLAAGRTPQPYKATDVTAALNATSLDAETLTLKAYLFPGQPSNQQVNAKSVGRRLKAHVGQPVRHEGKVLVLKSYMDKHTGTLLFNVTTIP